MAQIQTAKMQKFLTVFLCFWVAFFESFDLQAPGIAAKGIAETFALDQVQMGYVFSLGVFGMLFGAFFGGVLQIIWARKKCSCCQSRFLAYLCRLPPSRRVSKFYMQHASLPA